MTAVRAAVRFSIMGNENLNLPFKTAMNDRKAVIAMKFDNIEDVEYENCWAAILTNQVDTKASILMFWLFLFILYFQFLKREIELAEVKSLLLKSMVRIRFITVCLKYPELFSHLERSTRFPRRRVNTTHWI